MGLLSGRLARTHLVDRNDLPAPVADLQELGGAGTAREGNDGEGGPIEHAAIEYFGIENQHANGDVLPHPGSQGPIECEQTRTLDPEARWLAELLSGSEALRADLLACDVAEDAARDELAEPEQILRSVAALHKYRVALCGIRVHTPLERMPLAPRTW